MTDHVNNCIDLITEEIKNQKKKSNDFDVTGELQKGIIEGLEIARMILSNYWEENC